MRSDTLETIGEAPEPAIDPMDMVRRAIVFITEEWQRQPQLAAIAAHVGVAPGLLERTFTRIAGLTPKTFLQAVTLREARALLSGDASLLDAAYELGLSGPARLHDLFVTHEAMTPGAFKSRGEGLVMRWGFHASPFGRALLVATDRGLAGLGFSDGSDAAALAEFTVRWPAARFVEDRAATATLARRIFDPAEWRPDRPLRLVLIGSDFELRVWETLLNVPFGGDTSYSAVAAEIGEPKAARAVGAAVGRNPISFVVPCHRVLGKNGSLTGYHWGLTRKRAILGWEAGVSAAR